MQRFNWKVAGLTLACGSLLLFAGNGMAGNATTTVGVSASVTSLCTVSGAAASAMSFLPLTLSNQDFTGPTLTVACTSGSTSAISITGGANDGATSTDHYAAGSGAATGSSILYHAYTNSGRGTLWGDGTNGSTVSATADGTPYTYTIYLRVPSGQNTSPVGSYSDTLSISVSY